MKKKFKFTLAYQILAGLVLGIIVGAVSWESCSGHVFATYWYDLY